MSLSTPRDSAWIADSAPARQPMRSARPVTGESEVATRWTRLSTAFASSCGRRHAVNEDCHSALDRQVPVFVVADGVGGGALASHASNELVAQLHAALDGTRPGTDDVRDALLAADRAIGRSIAAEGAAAGAATVALCAALGSTLSRWLVAWVGDCRVYRMSAADDRAAQLLTRDDTYRHLNEAPPPGGSLDDPARMVGNGAVEAPNVRGIDLYAGEMLVLCSDGVHKHASADEIARVLREASPLARRCERLIELARLHGSRDDATVLVVHRQRASFARRARLAAAGTALALAGATALWLATGPSLAQRLLPSFTSHDIGVAR